VTVGAVVFDIGNVLLEWAPERFYDRAMGADRRRQLFAEVPIEAMNLDVDRGRPWADSVAALAAAHPDWATEIDMWHSRWLEMASPAIDRSVRLLRALRRAGVSVFALSNFGRETFALAVENYPFLEEFDRRYISAELGTIKPEPAIYAHLEADSGIAPERLLFTDDRLENIEAAAARGWQVHLFEGAEGWAARLVAEGLLTGEAAR